ncbi:MAG TPA: ATP-binding protein [Vicinamibacteria bacterium]|nr:ATP-binding protein [Vicinamibacteria bacterium]
MRLLSSLQNRIFLASATVAVLSIAFPIHFVTSRLEREVEAELERGLGESASLVEQQHAARLQSLVLMARLIADLPKLKAAVDTNEPTTVQPLAADYRELVSADLFAVANRSGDVLAALGGPAGAIADRSAIHAALAGRESTTVRAQPDGVLEMVTVPIGMERPGTPEVLGALSLGFILNDGLAVGFKRVTAGEVAFAADGTVRASSLPRADDRDLARVLGRPEISTVRLGENEYVALSRPLAPGGERAPVAIVLRSRTERLLFLRTFRTALVVAALVAVMVAIATSYALARTVTRPLAAITAAMHEMTATGDLARKIRLGRSWDDEDARVLAATFDTLTDSIARFQREAALRERLSALGRLSTVIAHEIRNPLMVIKASLRTLARENVSADEVRELAADIDHEVTRLNLIVDDVLDFARPVRLEYAPADLEALCRDVVAATLPRSGTPRCHVAIEPGLGPVTTDAERLRTALVNILANARDAALARSARGSETPFATDIEVRVSAPRPGRVVLEVEDHGMGIDLADLPHVFDPYFTTKRTGSGLGLAIAKNIVDAMGGAISAQSRPGEGTRIRIDLPAAPEPRPEPAPAAGPASAA